MSEWISVKERLPEETGLVIALHKNGEIRAERYSVKMKNFSFECILDRVTHWMPLPEPPGEEVDSDASDD